MKKYRHYFLIFCFLGCTQISVSQNLHFSQYFSSPLNLNPALITDFNGKLRLISNYKNQWASSSPQAYKTVSFSADAPISKHRLSAALSFYSDKAGIAKMQSNQANFTLASKVYVSRKALIGAALQAGLAQRSVDATNLTWDNQFDGKIFNPLIESGEPAQIQNFSYFDLTSGLLYRYVETDKFLFYTGISAYHLNSPRQSFYSANPQRLKPRWAVHADAEINLKNVRKKFMPSVLILKQGGAYEINFGASMKYRIGQQHKKDDPLDKKYFLLGLYTRWKDALIAFTQIDYNSKLSISMSYDINISKLRAATNLRGGIEIGLKYLIF